jgi:phage repressor protein C with HTH and peptisase S24 domain
LNQRDFAASLDTSHATVSFIERDERPPSRRFLQIISERYGISADWLLHGAGEQFHPPRAGFPGRTAARRIEAPDPELPAYGDFRFRGEDFAIIERADLCISAGPGVVPVEGAERDAIAFSRSWLLEQQINADLAVMVRVKGDSMAPTIPDGALVLVHLAEREVRKPGVYAFNRGDASFVKRLVPSGPDARGRLASLALLSDNPACGTEIVTGADLNGIQIIGRLRCVLTTL